MDERWAAAVVVGGIVGLAAAYELKTTGFAVSVFETSDRVAGRIWTANKGDSVTDLGTAVTCVRTKRPCP
jgi:monoamine oxidase